MKMSHKIAFNRKFAEKVKKILSIHYAYGFRIDSIELKRFRRFFSNEFRENNSCPDDELVEHISRCGRLFDGKVFIVTSQTKKKIRNTIEKHFANGAKTIFYAEFYSKNEKWLFDSSVISSEMLMEMLPEMFPDLFFKKNYFGCICYGKTSTVVKSEILRVWGDDTLMTYEQLTSRLPYIPLETIKETLSKNTDFIWNSENTYSLVEKIVLTDEEQNAIREAARMACNMSGYVTATDLPLEEVEERNNELSKAAICDAVFRICLSDGFDKNGRIIFHKGGESNIQMVLKALYRTLDNCSLDDLKKLEMELTGEPQPQSLYHLEAAVAVMIRVDKDTFVSEKHVDFSVDVIDEVIAEFVSGEYLPLKAFTTFAAFPHCKQVWNLFLLESYCRRFSKQFHFETLNANSRNVGTIVRKSHRALYKSYTEIMVDAVAKSDVALETDLLDEFLLSSGFTGRRGNAKIGEIIEKVKILRERML